MRDVALLGAGMHAWGKFPEKALGDLTRHAVSAALADAGVTWRDIQAVSAASSRFSGGKGWGLNGNDVVEDMGAEDRRYPVLAGHHGRERISSQHDLDARALVERGVE